MALNNLIHKCLKYLFVSVGSEIFIASECLTMHFSPILNNVSVFFLVRKYEREMTKMKNTPNALQGLNMLVLAFTQSFL